MPAEIEITADDITYAEGILLSEGKEFDSERKAFISNLDTIDLQAVPGSGKTTALLAKLVILERNLPFDDGAGILVISHTNTAVDEIKNRIGKHCPKLFNYPNFIGTIQSFVDQFLALPYGQNKLNARISWIDSDRYGDSLWNAFSSIYWDSNFNQPGKLFWSRCHTRAMTEAKNSNRTAKAICNDLIEKEVRDLYFDYSDKKIKVFRNDDTILSTPTNPRYIGIKSAIEQVIKSGVISYEYAYKLANSYCEQYPKVIELLQKRFRYVFVDEMQDMDKHQYELLEKVFFADGTSISKFQRIGDKNQAIYSSGAFKIKDIWTDRNTILTLNGSHRLSPPIANVVKHFALTRNSAFDINGLRENNIRPHLILYDDLTINHVIPRYASLIKTFQESGDIPLKPKHGFKAVAWNTDWNTEEDQNNSDKIRLIEYYPCFKRDKQKPKTEYPDLLSYLIFFNKEKGTLEPIRKNILNALLKVLRLENIVDEDGRNFTKRKLIKFLREQEADSVYEAFNQQVYNCCFDLIKGDESKAYREVKAYIPQLLELFDKTISNSATFINGPGVETSVQTEENETDTANSLEYDGVRIEVGTVHSSKGQTHTCTLYMETYYQGNYESERLSDQIKGSDFPSDEERVYHKQSTLISYVGFSRATHLLCLAIHKRRFDENLSGFDTLQWNIVDITGNID